MYTYMIGCIWNCTNKLICVIFFGGEFRKHGGGERRERWRRRRNQEEKLLLLQVGFFPGRVLQEFRKLHECPEADSDPIGRPGPDQIPGPDGAGGDEVSEPARDEEEPDVVGPDLVRSRSRRRRRNIRSHRTGDQKGRRPRRRLVLRRLRRLRHALRLLLHRICG